MKYILVLTVIIISTACGSPSSNSANPFADLPGLWEGDKEIIKAEMKVLFNEDGTMTTTLAGRPIEGSWKHHNGDTLHISGPHLKEGQFWIIKDLKSNSLQMDWVSSVGDRGFMPFKRIK